MFLFCQVPKFIQSSINAMTHVHVFKLDALRLQHVTHGKNVIYDSRHTIKLFDVTLDHLFSPRVYMLFHQSHFTVGLDDGKRGAKLVSNVRDKTLLRIKRRLHGSKSHPRHEEGKYYSQDKKDDGERAEVLNPDHIKTTCQVCARTLFSSHHTLPNAREHSIKCVFEK